MLGKGWDDRRVTPLMIRRRKPGYEAVRLYVCVFSHRLGCNMEPFVFQGSGVACFPPRSRPLNWTDPAPPGYPWSHIVVQVYQFRSYNVRKNVL